MCDLDNVGCGFMFKPRPQIQEAFIQGQRGRGLQIMSDHEHPLTSSPQRHLKRVLVGRLEAVENGLEELKKGVGGKAACSKAV